MTRFLVWSLSFILSHIFSSNPLPLLPQSSINPLQCLGERISSAVIRLRWVWCNYLPTCEHNTTFFHVIRTTFQISHVLVHEMLQLRNLFHRLWAALGFHLKPDTDILFLKAFHQHFGCFECSLRTMEINWDWNDLLYHNLEVFILHCKRWTALLQTFKVSGQGLDKSIILTKVSRYSGNLLVEFTLLFAHIIQFPLQILYSLSFSVPTFKWEVRSPQRNFCSPCCRWIDYVVASLLCCLLLHWILL